MKFPTQVRKEPNSIQFNSIQSCQSSQRPYISSSHFSFRHLPLLLLYFLLLSSTLFNHGRVLTQSSRRASNPSLLHRQQTEFVYHYLAGLNGQANWWNVPFLSSLTSLVPAPGGWWSHRSCSCSPRVCVSQYPAHRQCAGGFSQPARAVPAYGGMSPCAYPAICPAETCRQ